MKPKNAKHAVSRFDPLNSREAEMKQRLSFSVIVLCFILSLDFSSSAPELVSLAVPSIRCDNDSPLDNLKTSLPHASTDIPPIL
jgi:hypothetical protein